MVNVGLDIEWIRLKYMLETIKYNEVDPVIYWAQIFIKKSLEFREVLFGVHNLSNTIRQQLNNYSRF